MTTSYGGLWGDESGGPVASGGGGLVLRDPVDRFAGADLAACRAARDAYFSNAANAAALAEFQANQSLAVVLDPADAPDNTFQTYAPGNAEQAYDGTQWLDRTDAVQGNPGPAATGEFTPLANPPQYNASGLHNIPAAWNGKYVEIGLGINVAVDLVMTADLPVGFRCRIQVGSHEGVLTVNGEQLSGMDSWVEINRAAADRDIMYQGGHNPVPYPTEMAADGGKVVTLDDTGYTFRLDYPNPVYHGALPARGRYTGEAVSYLTTPANPHRVWSTGAVPPAGSFDSRATPAGFTRVRPATAGNGYGSLNAYLTSGPNATSAALIAWAALATVLPLGEWDVQNWEDYDVFVKTGPAHHFATGTGAAYTGYSAAGVEITKNFAAIPGPQVLAHPLRELSEIVLRDKNNRTRYYRRTTFGGWQEILDNNLFTKTDNQIMRGRRWNGNAWVPPRRTDVIWSSVAGVVTGQAGGSLLGAQRIAAGFDLDDLSDYYQLIIEARRDDLLATGSAGGFEVRIDPARLQGSDVATTVPLFVGAPAAMWKVDGNQFNAVNSNGWAAAIRFYKIIGVMV